MTKYRAINSERFVVECEVGEVRLVGPNNIVGTAGEVEYCYNGTQWLTACVDTWNRNLSSLICRLALGDDTNNGTRLAKI